MGHRSRSCNDFTESPVRPPPSARHVRAQLTAPRIIMNCIYYCQSRAPRLHQSEATRGRIIDGKMTARRRLADSHGGSWGGCVRVEGRFEVPVPREAVWRCITDPKLMVGCIPGCEAIDTIDARNYRATVRVEVGPIKA